MAYRDDREALHNRVAVLEQELVDARREGEEQGRDEAQARAVVLQQKLDAMRGELAKMEAELRELRGDTPRRAPNTTLLTAGALLGGLAFGGLILALRTKPAPPPPSVPAPHVEPLAVPVAPTPPAPIALEPLPSAARPPAEPRSTTARWNATVSRSDGIPVVPGSACTIDATITTTDTNAIVRNLDIMCGAVKLYRSSDRLNGMSQSHNDAREKLGPKDDQSTFTMTYRDIGSRSGDRAQVDLDSSARQASVFRDTIPRFRVDLAVPTTSVPGAPLSGPAQRLRRTGKVTEVTGAAPFKTGATCVLRAMATGRGRGCVAEVACGATTVWPSSAPVTCDYEGSRPVSVASDQGPTSLSFEGPKLTVKAQSFGASIALDEPRAASAE